jgi:hypothetical protein
MDNGKIMQPNEIEKRIRRDLNISGEFYWYLSLFMNQWEVVVKLPMSAQTIRFPLHQIESQMSLDLS